MQKSWKPTVAGVLAVTGGALILLFASIISLSMVFSAPFRSTFLAAALFGGLYLGAGLVALIGGISALQRRRWGLALAGAICALMPPSTMLGIASIVFTTIARDDFSTVPASQPAIDTAGGSTPDGSCDRARDFGGPSEGERNA